LFYASQSHCADEGGVVEPRRWTPWLRWVGIGWYITASILVGLLGGLWLDRTLRLMEFPLFMFLGLLLGLAAAVRGVYRMLTLSPPDKGRQP
jgi:hypothetical protein